MRKRGKSHSRLAVKPLGMKSNRYELDARMALLAVERNSHKEQHLVDLYALSTLCAAMTSEQHIKAHSAAVDRICDEIHKKDCTPLQAISLAASVHILLDWFLKQPNILVAQTALKLSRKLAA